MSRYRRLPLYPNRDEKLRFFAQINIAAGGATPDVSPSVTPSNTVTPSITPSITPTSSITPTATPSVTTTPSNTVTPTQSVTPSNTQTPSATPSSSITPTPSITNTPSSSITPTATPSISITPSTTLTPSITPSITPSTPLSELKVVSVGFATDGGLISNDFINFTGTTLPGSGSVDYQDIAYSPTLDRYVSGDSSTTDNGFIYSDDGGITWSSGTINGFTTQIWSIVWNDDLGEFYALGYRPDIGYISSDGITWNTQSTPFNNDTNVLIYDEDNNLYLVTDQLSGYYTSPDGITWTLRLSGSDRWSQLCRNSYLGITVAYNGWDNNTHYSTDDITWSAGSITNAIRPAGLNMVALDPNIHPYAFLSVDPQNRTGYDINRSVDGINWTGDTVSDWGGVQGNALSGYFDDDTGTYWITSDGATGGGFAYSTDYGDTWTRVPTIRQRGFYVKK